ncbi:hypothetical protein THRCLA_04319 [Thraustotheca clavata]|uniref:Cyclic nucleotide-binding domain-containing protein n=1 Tax=Thraustotheca clavata TaxID=74557 RepID=A0A1V9ZZG2_9STRA|nr:hypothetical protein THRCLA_04319 [Thraustotheca clavata]
MTRRKKASRESVVIASAKALGITVGDGVSAAEALQTHNAPHDLVFDKALNSTTRLFLRQIAKQKATPKHLRSKPPVVSLVPQKCVLLADANRPRREAMSLVLDGKFKVLLAGSSRDTLQVLQMYTVHMILARLTIGKDDIVQLIAQTRHKGYTVPVVVATPPDANPELLADALVGGACGHLDDSNLSPTELRERLVELMSSFDSIDREFKIFKSTDSKAARKRSSMVFKHKQPLMAGRRRSSAMEAATEAAILLNAPLTAGYAKMLEVDAKIQDRQNFFTKHEHVVKIMQVKHSAVGIAENEPPLPLSSDVMRKSIPKPSHDEINSKLYTQPHAVATMVQVHDYDVTTRPEKGPVFQEPLLEHCVVVDPATLISTSPTHAVSRITKAYLFYTEGQYSTAIHWCTVALSAEPFNLPKWVLLIRGAAHDRIGENTQALHDFTAAFALDDQFHQAKFNESVSLLKLGRDYEALNAIVHAQEIDPKKYFPAYVRNHAFILRRLGKFEAARVVYAKLDVKESTEDDNEAKSLDRMLEVNGLRGGLFDALFCQSRHDKVGFFTPPGQRTPQMLDIMMSTLKQFDFFAHIPNDVIEKVCQSAQYAVIKCGDIFELAAVCPMAFYVCLSGTLSVHANLTLSIHDAAAVATSTSTLRLHAGAIFGIIIKFTEINSLDILGCVGYCVSNLMMYLADERTEVLYLAPTVYKETLEPQWLLEQHARFSMFRKSNVFQALSDSDLGHIVSHSILFRFHKGDVLINQGQVPKHLYLLYKGICRFEQKFENEQEGQSCTMNDSLKPSSLPSHKTPKVFHHLLANPAWPMGYTRKTHSPTKNTKSTVLKDDVRKGKNSNNHKAKHLPTITYDLYPPALFGEAAYLEVSQLSKCSIIANTLVEALAVDVHQLKSLNAAKDLLLAIGRRAPMYLDRQKAEKMQEEHEKWLDIRGKETLHLNKARWPVSKKRLRYLPNGSSLVLPDESILNDNN